MARRKITMKVCRGALAFVCLVGIGAVSAATIAPGTPAPDFVLKATSGKNVRLKEHRGEVVMINFWATWCGPCRDEMPVLNRLYEKYRNAGFTLLGVNIDEDAGKAAEMAKRLGVSYLILHDAEKQVGKSYQIDAMPTTVLIDRDGKVRYTHRGYHTDYEKLYHDQVRQLLK